MELVLPRNYVEIEQEEMMYLDGGLYIDNNTVQGIAFATGITGYTSIAVAITYVKWSAVLIAAKLATIPGGNIIAFLGSAYIMANAGNIAPALVSAALRKKGMDIGIDWWYGIPVLSFSAR